MWYTETNLWNIFILFLSNCKSFFSLRVTNRKRYSVVVYWYIANSLNFMSKNLWIRGGHQISWSKLWICVDGRFKITLVWLMIMHFKIRLFSFLWLDYCLISRTLQWKFIITALYEDLFLQLQQSVCKSCKGRRVVRGNKTVKLNVIPGMLSEVGCFVDLLILLCVEPSD